MSVGREKFWKGSLVRKKNRRKGIDNRRENSQINVIAE